ncbi:MAG: M20 family metallopeptidase [Crocinitomicaceae bacterium]|nr:M20 family metallopeptidase [Crocinitomicaceae bacterium]
MNPELLIHIEKRATEVKEKVLKYRHHIHQNPELSFNEKKTQEYVSMALKAIGVPHKKIGKTGITAIISTQKTQSKSAICLRSELDALPIQEETQKSYSSKVNGVMHACGHDVHTAILLGVAEILNEIKEELNNPVKLLFQPGEEKLPGGATLMIKNGVLENPIVDKMFALHVFPELDAGFVGFKEGRYMASCDEIYITIKGVGGHAAMPDKCIDPIAIGASIIMQLQQLISRKCDPKTPSVLSFGTFEGIGATNVIPSIVKLEGTFRTMDEEWRSKAVHLIEEQVKAIAETNGAKAKINIIKGYPCLDNNIKLTRELKEKAKLILGNQNVIDLPIRMTSEDFSFYSQSVPVCFFRLGVRNEKKGIIHGVHHPLFDIDDEALITGIKIMCAATL